MDVKQRLQGKKTHEQQLRTLQRQPDVPDARRTEAELRENTGADAAKVPDPHARQSEFPVSRGGMNQESQHNKHNHPEAGPQKDWSPPHKG